jgi:hypothetical protein
MKGKKREKMTKEDKGGSGEAQREGEKERKG